MSVIGRWVAYAARMLHNGKGLKTFARIGSLVIIVLATCLVALELVVRDERSKLLIETVPQRVVMMVAFYWAVMLIPALYLWRRIASGGSK